MILVWSVPRDSAASAVAAALERWGADARFSIRMTHWKRDWNSRWIRA
jgi:hypothetical protein